MRDYNEFPDSTDGLFRLLRGANALAAIIRADLREWNETPQGEPVCEHATQLHSDALRRLCEVLHAAKPRFDRHGLTLAGTRAAAFSVNGRSFPTAHHAAFALAAETIAAALPDAVRREVGRLGGKQAEAECDAWRFGFEPETATLGTFELIGRATLQALCDGLQFGIDCADFDAIDAELVIELARTPATTPAQGRVDGSAVDVSILTPAERMAWLACESGREVYARQNPTSTRTPSDDECWLLLDTEARREFSSKSSFARALGRARARLGQQVKPRRPIPDRAA